MEKLVSLLKSTDLMESIYDLPKDSPKYQWIKCLMHN